jgi:SAM-dependent methyltransferase
MEYSSIHKETYDELADEYESRVDALIPVTTDAMDYFSSHIRPGGSVLDLGCAVGIAINILTQKGFQCTGIEISPRMATFAGKRNPDCKIITGDFLSERFGHKFDAVLAFAFIHLFPKEEIVVILDKIKSILNQGGVALISTTESAKSGEGWEIKNDYDKKMKRFRKSWTENELRETLDSAGLKILALKKFTDPFGKTWMDFVVKNHSD